MRRDASAVRSSGIVNSNTHIDGVVRLRAVGDLTGVILCAHSYGGMVAAGVADRASERIGGLVYVDALVPEDGQSWWDLAGDGYRKIAIERARRDGFGVAPPENLDPRCAPHPLASFVQALRLQGRANEIARRVFVYASGWSATPFTAQYERLCENPAWTVRTLACGHDVINAAPDAAMEILTEVARNLSS